MRGRVVGGVEPARQPQQLGVAPVLALGTCHDASQVDEERPHGLCGEAADPVGVARARRAAREPGDQPTPVVRVEPGSASGGPPLEVDETLAGVGPLAEGGDARPQDGDDVGDLWHVSGDLVDEALEVVEQRRLERLELGPLEVEAAEHLGEVGVELPCAVDEPVELGEDGADALREVLGRDGREVVGLPGQLAQAAQDGAEHLAADLGGRLGVAEELVDLPLDELAPLGQLVARAVAQVVLQAARLGLARAAGEVAVLDQVGEARIDGVLVEVDSRIGQPGRDLGGGLVGQHAGEALREEAHDRDVARGLIVHGIPKRLEAHPVDPGGALVGHGQVGHRRGGLL